jgi:hypothetical protein
VARQADLSLPVFASDLFVYDNAETTITAYVALAQEDVIKLLGDGRFRSSTRHEVDPVLRTTERSG